MGSKRVRHMIATSGGGSQDGTGTDHDNGSYIACQLDRASRHLRSVQSCWYYGRLAFVAQGPRWALRCGSKSAPECSQAERQSEMTWAHHLQPHHTLTRTLSHGHPARREPELHTPHYMSREQSKVTPTPKAKPQTNHSAFFEAGPGGCAFASYLSVRQKRWRSLRLIAPLAVKSCGRAQRTRPARTAMTPK